MRRSSRTGRCRARRAAGLAVRRRRLAGAAATRLPQLAGFVVPRSTRWWPRAAGALRSAAAGRPSAADAAAVTAMVIVSPLGDVASAARVAEAVDTGGRVGPLLFFQSVPNAVAGHVAARWGLTGPVCAVGAPRRTRPWPALLLADGDADEALVILAEQAAVAEASPDRRRRRRCGAGRRRQGTSRDARRSAVVTGIGLVTPVGSTGGRGVRRAVRRALRPAPARRRTIPLAGVDRGGRLRPADRPDHGAAGDRGPHRRPVHRAWR